MSPMQMASFHATESLENDTAFYAIVLDYLNIVQQRTIRRMETANFAVGGLVLVKEENTPSIPWPCGRITKTFVGNDGIICVVQLRTETGFYKRPFSKL